MLKIYGTPGSRAARTLWICRELGLQYEHIPTHFADGGTKAPEFLAINPAGRVPAIDDDGFRLAESMAINIYLAKKHGGELAPKSLEDEARMLQWTFWAMTEVEKPLLTVLMQRLELPPGSEIEKYFRERSPKDAAAEQAALTTLEHPMSVLNGHVQIHRQWMVRSYAITTTFVTTRVLTAIPSIGGGGEAIYVPAQWSLLVATIVLASSV
ncbi:MAG: glutathione S-transferase family protein [Rhodospirillales bacterium]|nr:glutathione S-transferase family protein [Rhodospirillales bacterium]